MGLNPILIGYRCCGKTTIGKELADRLSLGFMDTDALVEATAGCTISQLIEEKGWLFFREMESQLLQRTIEQPNLVISTGGGIILDPKNREMIKKQGRAIWLKADAETIVQRLKGDDNAHRPRFNQKDSLYKETCDMLDQRTGLYRETASLTIDTTTQTISQVVDTIIRRLNHGRV